ncbi:unnamed protein product, partial [Cyprideis torosa]
MEDSVDGRFGRWKIRSMEDSVDGRFGQFVLKSLDWIAAVVLDSLDWIVVVVLKSLDWIAVSKHQITLKIIQLSEADLLEGGICSLRKVRPYLSKMSIPVPCTSWNVMDTKEFLVSTFYVSAHGVLEKKNEAGEILVNDRVERLDRKLQKHDVITAILHMHEPPVIDIPPTIIYQDDSILVVNKPPSVVVHPAYRFKWNSLTDILLLEHADSIDLSRDSPILKTVHRLDKQVSGILVSCKSREAANEWSKYFQLRVVKKTYLAIVEGEFPAEKVVCDARVQRPKGLALSFISESGKKCQTVFQRIKVSNCRSRSLVLCQPITGRGHQIRVHLQYLG